MNSIPKKNNRIFSLDALRGFALLGIFIANMLTFHTPYMYIDSYTWFDKGSEAQAFQWIVVLVEASFYPLFAMMFGYGLNMQYEKAVKLQRSFAPMAARRMSILLVFGVLHALFIWTGDILFTYAALGFIMIAAVRIPKKWLLIIASVVYLAASSLLIIVFYLLWKANPEGMLTEFVNIQQIEQTIEAYGRGTYGEAFAYRVTEWLMIGPISVLTGIVMILPLMMLGAAFSKMHLFERVSELKGKIVVFSIVALVVGILLKALPILDAPHFHNQMIQKLIGGPILALGYAGIVLLLCEGSLLRKLFRPLAKAGRMSLTTYLMQSIIGTLIFYNYGLGLYGKVDVQTGTLIAIGVFAIQVIFAEIWLSKFKMGPFEWIWRKGTYGKKMKQKEG